VAEKVAGDKSNWTISAKPRAEALEGTRNLKVKITLANYASHAGIEVPFTVLVNTADCDCSLVTYDPPTRLD